MFERFLIFRVLFLTGEAIVSNRALEKYGASTALIMVWWPVGGALLRVLNIYLFDRECTPWPVYDWRNPDYRVAGFWAGTVCGSLRCGGWW